MTRRVVALGKDRANGTLTGGRVGVGEWPLVL